MSAKEVLLEKARQTIQANMLETDQGWIFFAGGNQFRTFWMRDFFYSVPGLLALGYKDEVKSALNLVLGFKREDGLIPRGIDFVNPKLRVSLSMLFGQRDVFKWTADKTLKAEYLGEHGTHCIDSNLLFIDALLCSENSESNRELSRDLLKFYQLDEDGMITQPPYSDWQDSAKREGKILLTQLLLVSAYQKLEMQSEFNRLRQNILSKFFSQNEYLFFETVDKSFFALDSHLFCLRRPKLFTDVVDLGQLYKSLRTSDLWRRGIIPGIPTSQNYKSSDVSWTTKLVGLRHYHDNLIWAWLAAEACTVAFQFGDAEEASRILQNFSVANENEAYLAEIYDPDLKRSFKSFAYRSERPFTWTAAKWAEALTYFSPQT